MDCHRHRLAVIVVAALAFALAVRADQGIPVYTSVNPQPAIGSTCAPIGRVWIDATGNNARTLCCSNAATWDDCGTTSSGVNGILQIADGAGGFSSYAGGACTNQFMVGLDTQGLRSCSSVTDPFVTSIGAGKLTFADSTTYNFGKATPTGVVLNLGHNGTAALANTVNFAAHAHSTAAGSGGQIAYSNLSGLPTLAPTGAQYVVSAADATLTAERVATATATIGVDAGTAGQMKWNVLYAPELTCTGCAALGAEVSATSTSDLTLDGPDATAVATMQASMALKLTSAYWNGAATADSTWSITSGYNAASAAGSELRFTAPGGGIVSVNNAGDLVINGSTTGSALRGGVYVSRFADGAGGTAHEFRTNGAYVQGKLFSIRNDTTEKVGVDKDGVITAGGFIGAVTANANGAALPTCDSTASGKMFIKRAASTPDQIHVCLQNGDATWGWAMFAIAVK